MRIASDRDVAQSFRLIEMIFITILPEIHSAKCGVTLLKKRWLLGPGFFDQND